MLVRIKRKTNIIQTPDNFATLERITVDGYFVYNIVYYIDPIKATKENVRKVNIELTQFPKTKPAQVTFQNFNPPETVRKLLLRETFIKDTNNTDANNPAFFSYVSDIGKFIPKDMSQTVSRSNFVDRPFIKKVKKFRTVQVSELNRRNLNVPIFDINLNRDTEDEKIQVSRNDVSTNSLRERGSEVAEISNKLLTELGVDPSVFASSPTNSFLGARRVGAGLSPKRANDILDIGQIKTLMPESEILIKSLLSRTSVTNQNQVPQDAYISVPTEDEQYFIEVKETFNIPLVDIIFDEFTVNFELIDRNDLIVETYDEYVNHSQNVLYKNIPIKAPLLRKTNVSNRSGLNVFEVQQTDPNATKIFVFKKAIKKNVSNANSEYGLVREIDITAEEDSFKFIDEDFIGNPTIYRAVAGNDDGHLTAEYSSIVLGNKNTNIVPEEKFDKKPHFLSFDYQVNDNSIAIGVENIAYGAISLQLLRRQASLLEKEYRPIGEPELVDSDGNRTTFTDINVAQGRIYEYAIKMFFKDGSEELSSNTQLIEFSPVVSNIAVAVIGPPSVTQNDNGEMDVQFDIERRIIENDPDLIKKFVEEQGLLGEFQENIIANKEALQNLFSAGVKRFNIITGEYEDFGVIPELEFSDRRFGTAKNVKPLEENMEYRYQVTLYARNTETLFPQLEKEITDINNRSYTFKPSKWRHPITLTKGNIVSERTLRKNYANSNFSFGTIADIKTVEVSLGEVMPNIETAGFKQVAKNTNLIEWSVRGNPKQIDHYIIVQEILGIKTIVGKSHSLGDNTLFSYTHILESEEAGQISYEIVPVYYDFGRGIPQKTNSVVI